jgi:hypothetical protein
MRNLIVVKSKRNRSQVSEMNGFMNWYQNKIQAVHMVSDEVFVDIMHKL